ncbi:protein of unknown function [Thauera humireducens]|nr:protein of unknown function [Thauera humireducens]CAH1749021.1 protein of unknown function [Thauera humireducens]
MPKCSAICRFCMPSAASNTMRARCDNLTLVSRELVSFINSARSSSVKTISGATRIRPSAPHA